MRRRLSLPEGMRLLLLLMLLLLLLLLLLLFVVVWQSCRHDHIAAALVSCR